MIDAALSSGIVYCSSRAKLQILSDISKTKIVAHKGKSHSQLTTGSSKDNTTWSTAASGVEPEAPPLLILDI